jgi:hypothetical protein
MLDPDFSYHWLEERYGDLTIIRSRASNGEFVEERYLSGGDATQFRREYNAARNKEASRAFKEQCRKGIMSPGELVQNTMSIYF